LIISQKIDTFAFEIKLLNYYRNNEYKIINMAKKAKREKELRLKEILFNRRYQLRVKAAMADKRDLLLTLVFLRLIGEKFTNQREIIYKEQIAKGQSTFMERCCL